MDKRHFLKKLGSAALISPFMTLPLQAEPKTAKPYPKTNNAFWERIRADYELKTDYINLENGYYNLIPKPTMQRYMEHISMVNYEASFYMRTVQWDNKDKVRDRLAALVGVSPDTLIITRNTTESLDMVIGGYPWKKGDEAIFAYQDYGAMQDHFKLIAKRYGVVNRIISLPNHPDSDTDIVSLYESQITPKTRLLMVCHMVNITGQLLPIRKICDMAHKYGVEVMVDGAHCVGHFDFSIQDLNCDYYGSSLHKWLSAPLGCGLLYVKKEHIPKIWPLFADYTNEIPEIKRLNHTGTIPVHNDLAIADAMDYLEIMGLKRKEERLRFLQFYWSDALRDVEHIEVNTPKDKTRSCGIGNIGITHIKPAQLATTLLQEFKIFTVAIDQENVQGCRITPNVYTTTKELDVFISAMKNLAARV